MRSGTAILLLIAASAACDRTEADDVGIAESSPTATTTSQPPPTSTAPPVNELLMRNTMRARTDALARLPRLQRLARVTLAFPTEVRRVLEQPDDIVLYSVAWSGGDVPLDAVLNGTASTRSDVFGQLTVAPEDRTAIVAWLYDGVTRPFEGMRCNQPHHAFLFRRGSAAVGIAVCFECGTLELRGKGTYRARVRWDPAFRDFLKMTLEAAGIRDLSSDLRP